MSTVATPTAVPSPPEPVKLSPAESLIDQRIEQTRKSLWWSELSRRGLLLAIVLMAAVLLWVLIDHWVYESGRGVRFLAFAALAGWGAWYCVTRVVRIVMRRITPEYAARSLERDLPELKQQLTSYVTLRSEAASSGLQRKVIGVLGARAAGKLKTHDAPLSEAAGTFKWWMVAAGVFAILFGYAVLSPKNFASSAARLLAPWAKIEPARRVAIQDVQPGNTKTLAGRTLSVSALVQGRREEEAVLCTLATTTETTVTEMTFDEESGRFVGDVEISHTASGSANYVIECGDGSSRPFDLQIENVPVVAIDSVEYEPPAYTAQAAYRSSSAAISAIDGTVITLTAETNRPVARAELQFNPKLLGQAVSCDRRRDFR